MSFARLKLQVSQQLFPQLGDFRALVRRKLKGVFDLLKDAQFPVDSVQFIARETIGVLSVAQQHLALVGEACAVARQSQPEVEVLRIAQGFVKRPNIQHKLPPRDDSRSDNVAATTE